MKNKWTSKNWYIKNKVGIQHIEEFVEIPVNQFAFTHTLNCDNYKVETLVIQVSMRNGEKGILGANTNGKIVQLDTPQLVNDLGQFETHFQNIVFLQNKYLSFFIRTDSDEMVEKLAGSYEVERL